MKKVAVVMAGGTGTRFWPLSRRNRPKQLLSIGDHPVMLKATLDRLKQSVPEERILIVTSGEHSEPIRTVAEDLPRENILVEPEGRDTAPCSGLGALVARKRFGSDAVIGSFPADHRIVPTEAFTKNADAAYRAAHELDSIVTFGVKPTQPATGYGYILPEDMTRTIEEKTFKKVKRFTEKPDRNQAMDYIDDSDALWNSGMFFWPAERILTEIEHHAPELSDGLERIFRDWQSTGSLSEALSAHYGSLPEISVDYAILENTDRCWTLPVDFHWNDLGTWESVEELFEPDENGNVIHGDVVLCDSTDNIVYDDDQITVGVVGMEDTVVVVTDDAVLVCPKDQSEKVKTLVNELEKQGRRELL